jgi:Trk-type K+ transport system membrane component
VKFLLLPLVIVAFVAFLLILGAIGFAVAFAILATLGRLWRLVSRSERPRRS